MTRIVCINMMKNRSLDSSIPEFLLQDPYNQLCVQEVGGVQLGAGEALQPNQTKPLGKLVFYLT